MSDFRKLGVKLSVRFQRKIMKRRAESAAIKHKEHLSKGDLRDPPPNAVRVNVIDLYFVLQFLFQ